MLRRWRRTLSGCETTTKASPHLDPAAAGIEASGSVSTATKSDVAQTVWDYFEERERECARLSLVADPEPQCAAVAGSGGTRGRYLATLHLNDRAYLQVSERIVVMDGTHVHREDYGGLLGRTHREDHSCVSLDGDTDLGPDELGKHPGGHYMQWSYARREGRIERRRYGGRRSRARSALRVIP